MRSKLFLYKVCPVTNVGGAFFSYNFHIFSKFYCRKFGLCYKLLYICINKRGITVLSTKFINYYNLSIAMEKTNFTEAQSLELITSMINDTRSRLARNSGTPFLIWGYTTVAIALLNSITTYLQLSYYWNFSWYAIPLIGWIGMMIFNKTDKGARNIIDRVISIIWGVLGITFIWVFIGAWLYGSSILYYTILIMGVGTIMTGLILRHNITLWCGCAAMICSIVYPIVYFLISKDVINPEITASLYKLWTWSGKLYFAAIFLVMMVVPGHILNYKYRK